MFSLFGLDTNNSINLIIAVVAVLGFLFSIFISLKSLKKQVEISLLDKRISVLAYFFNFFSRFDDLKTEHFDIEYEEKIMQLKLMFPDSRHLYEACVNARGYFKYDLEEIDDYIPYNFTSEKLFHIKPRHVNNSSINTYLCYILYCINKLLEKISLTKAKAKNMRNTY